MRKIKISSEAKKIISKNKKILLETIKKEGEFNVCFYSNVKLYAEKYKLKNFEFKDPFKSLEYYLRFDILFSPILSDDKKFSTLYLNKKFISKNNKGVLELEEFNAYSRKAIISYMTSENGFKYIKNNLKIKDLTYQIYTQNLMLFEV